LLTDGAESGNGFSGHSASGTDLRRTRLKMGGRFGILFI
jgi:hypothetical protein